MRLLTPKLQARRVERGPQRSKADAISVRYAPHKPTLALAPILSVEAPVQRATIRKTHGH